MGDLWALEPVTDDTRSRLVNNTGAPAHGVRISAQGFVLLGVSFNTIIEHDLLDAGDGIPLELKLGQKWRSTGPRLDIEWAPGKASTSPTRFSIDLLRVF